MSQRRHLYCPFNSFSYLISVCVCDGGTGGICAGTTRFHSAKSPSSLFILVFLQKEQVFLACCLTSILFTIFHTVAPEPILHLQKISTFLLRMSPEYNHGVLQAIDYGELAVSVKI